MAEKFCNKFGPGAHQLKIGKSFEKKGGNSVYHSIRYDFKPVSVDEDRMGKLEVSYEKISQDFEMLSYRSKRTNPCLLLFHTLMDMELPTTRGTPSRRTPRTAFS